ncbi:MAG: hypothetical protein WAN82_07315 [Candidatus Bathyarchaeia archaeon]
MRRDRIDLGSLSILTGSGALPHATKAVIILLGNAKLKDKIRKILKTHFPIVILIPRILLFR